MVITFNDALERES